jgi:Tfp pilus assembly protein PilX
MHSEACRLIVHSRLRRLRDAEEGVAMIIAILISFVVMVLGIVSVQIAIHNSGSSGYDRRRVQAIAAAEGGIDYYFSHLSSTPVGSIQCTLTGTLTNTPAGTFSANATFYNAAGSALPFSGSDQCPLGETPATVTIQSTGRASANSSPARTMETNAKLTPTKTAPFDNKGAIFAQSAINLQANTRIGGSQYSDADLYSNGNITITANSTLYGNVYSQGSVTLQANSEAKQSVWANGSVTMKGNSRVRRDVISSTSFLSLAGQSHIYGNAQAGTTISGGIIDGNSIPNAPTSTPPARAYPVYTYNSADWAALGYTVRNYTSCTTAVTDIENWWASASGSNVVRVTGGCTMTFSNAVTVKGNLAVVTDGSVMLATRTRFTPAAGTGPWDLHFFVGLNGVAPCSFTAMPHAGMNSGINTLIYTHQACTADIESNSALADGQIIAGTVNVKHSTSFRYKQVPVPGSTGTGFKQDIRYKREIVTSP